MAMKPVRGRAATPSRPIVGVEQVFEEFTPISEWQQDEESDILLLFLPGFLKQHLKVSTEGRNIVKVRGERLVTGSKWSRFQENYQVPERCNIRAVRARFEGGILNVTMPWKKDQTDKESFNDAATTQIVPPMEVPPKTLSSPDAQKQLISPGKEPIESIPQKSVDTPPNVPSPPPLKAADEKTYSEPQTQKGQFEERDRLQKQLMSRGKEPKESTSQKGFIDTPLNELTSPPPLKPAIFSDKGKDEKTHIEPQTQKGQFEERDRLTDSLKPTTAMQKSVDHGVEKKDFRGETKGKLTKSEKLESSKDETSNDKKANQKNEGLVDNKAERVAKEMGNEEKEKPTTTSIASSSSGYGLGNYKQAVRSLAELNEERQLLVNVGVAVLVIVALGTYITHTIGSREA